MTPKQQHFVLEYLVDLNATKAAERAGFKQPHSQGSRLLENVEIRTEIQKEMDRRAKRTGITAEKVLEEMWHIATVDANELVQFRRVCCRYCWGEGFKYQRTAAEMERDRVEYEARLKEAKEDEITQPFNERGGIGYNGTADPNPDCPECFGLGYGDVFIQDTRKVSPHARSLYAGVKRTKDGIEIKVHPKEKALEMLGRHLKLFTDVVEHKGLEGLSDRLAKARERAKNR